MAEVLERGGPIPRDEQLAQAAESAADVRRVLRAGRGIVGENAGNVGPRSREPEMPVAEHPVPEARLTSKNSPFASSWI